MSIVSLIIEGGKGEIYQRNKHKRQNLQTHKLQFNNVHLDQTEIALLLLLVVHTARLLLSVEVDGVLH